jgi:hypothetical protein
MSKGQNGKGHTRRPCLVSLNKYANNHARTFNDKTIECVNCSLFFRESLIFLRNGCYICKYCAKNEE